MAGLYSHVIDYISVTVKPHTWGFVSSDITRIPMIFQELSGHCRDTETNSTRGKVVRSRFRPSFSLQLNRMDMSLDHDKIRYTYTDTTTTYFLA